VSIEDVFARIESLGIPKRSSPHREDGSCAGRRSRSIAEDDDPRVDHASGGVSIPISPPPASAMSALRHRRVARADSSFDAGNQHDPRARSPRRARRARGEGRVVREHRDAGDLVECAMRYEMEGPTSS
jgi:hypothetical protein